MTRGLGNQLDDELSESHELDYQYTDEARDILAKLEDCIDELDFSSQNFVTDLSERFAQWGDRTLVSERQIQWLRDLEERYT